MNTELHAPDPTRRVVLFRLAALAASLPAAAAAAAAPPIPAGEPAPLPADSIHHLDALLTDHQGRTQPLSARRGQPLLLTMFYTGCQAVCPMIVEALRHTEARLAASERARLQVLMVSFDSERDTVPVLARTFAQRQLDARRWSLARADARTVRRVAAMLGIPYRQLPDGEFNHGTSLLAIDAEGRIAGRTSQLGSADPVFVAQVRAMLRADH